VLELVDLGYKRDALVTSLSRGMTQRLGLARVLLHDPQVLLLDEPASGLDPRARIEMRGLLKELRNMGKTIMVSSHILPELADICNKIGIIERGELLRELLGRGERNPLRPERTKIDRRLPPGKPDLDEKMSRGNVVGPAGNLRADGVHLPVGLDPGLGVAAYDRLPLVAAQIDPIGLRAARPVGRLDPE
jgi:ABC-type multidrug transport system ATPase subunit